MFSLLSTVSCRAYVGDFAHRTRDFIALVMDEPQLPQPRVNQAQAAIDAENQAAPPQEQPQAQPEVQTTPNAVSSAFLLDFWSGVLVSTEGVFSVAFHLDTFSTGFRGNS